MSPLKIFKVKPEERVQAVVALAVIVVLNALFIYRLHSLFMQPGFGPYWKAFEHEFHLSGYDPISYLGITEWDVVYQVHRHPLLAFMIFPLYLLNQGLTWLSGVNCVQYVIALPLVCCSVYSYLFAYRIFREVVTLERQDATLLAAFYFSFAYILLSVIVPDHFTPSMFLLLLSLYISGVCIRKGREFRWWQSALLFFVTAGVTLSNGIKVFLAGFFVNLRDFFRPKYLLLAVILPAGLLWGVAQWEYSAYTVPKEKLKKAEQLHRAEVLKARVATMTPEERARFEQKKARRQAVLRRQAAKTGKPMEEKGFLKWTDTTTPRWQSIYENLFGESILFHQQHFLEDTLVGRPVFVPYEWKGSYFAEAIILLLTAIGVWMGRRSRFLWLCLSCLGFDMFIHLILGFGLNEVFIMAPHFLFVLPIAIAFVFRFSSGMPLRVLRWLLMFLTFCLFCSNGWLLVGFLLQPIHATI